MRARQLRRATPIAMLASLTLISTPGVTFADPAVTPQDAQVQLAAQQEQNQEQNDEKSLDKQIEAAKKALDKAKKQTDHAKNRLDNTTSEHEKAKKNKAAAQDRLAKAQRQLSQAETELARAEERVSEHSAAGFSFDGMVNSILAFLGSDVTNSMQQNVDAKRDVAAQAQNAVAQAERDVTKTQQALNNAQKAHEQAVSQQDQDQSELDKLNEQKAQEEQAVGGGAAPAASPSGVGTPAEGTFTSGYGPRWGSTHYGIDIANAIGTPIYSVMPGTVISSGPASGFGLWVRVQHDNGLITVYGHINESLVSVGQRVEAGQQIATMGNRGQSTGPHLHFEVHENGVKIDPLPWLESHGITL